MGLDDDVVKEEFAVKDETELGAVMNNLDSDEVDDETNMSKIDFNARLTQDVINACSVFDELKRMGILPKNVDLSRQIKRLSVSLKGMGRAEKVKIVSAEREQARGGFFDRMGSLFSRRE